MKMDLKGLSNEEIIALIKEGKVRNTELTDNGICPTCFDKEHDGVLFGNNEDKILYEDDELEVFFVGNPRAQGHTAISTKKHYKDMMEIDDEICNKVFLLSKKVMNIIKEVYGTESVYLCTMCDGPMNHFHVQLIPRYSYEKRGSKNFVKERMEYVEDIEKRDAIRARLGE
jgi:histidine triad (HIT) family protein